MTQPPPEGIRWHQRLDSYQRALAQLQKAVELQQTRQLSELERQGLIQVIEADVLGKFFPLMQSFSQRMGALAHGGH